jgi:exosome complex component RRP45
MMLLKPGHLQDLMLSRILVQISAEVTKPLEDRKFDGDFTINVELSPIASASFETGRRVSFVFGRMGRLG